MSMGSSMDSLGHNTTQDSVGNRSVKEVHLARSVP